MRKSRILVPCWDDGILRRSARGTSTDYPTVQGTTDAEDIRRRQTLSPLTQFQPGRFDSDSTASRPGPPRKSSHAVGKLHPLLSISLRAMLSQTTAKFIIRDLLTDNTIVLVPLHKGVSTQNQRNRSAPSSYPSCGKPFANEPDD